MKIDSAKSNEANRRSEPSKTDSSLRPSISQTSKILETPAPNNGAFAKILEEARKNSGKDRETTNTREKDRAQESSKSSDSESDDSMQSVHHRETIEEKEKHKGDSKGGNDGDGDQTAFAAAFFFENRNIKENSFPAARAILHVADLERIVSAIRSQNLAQTKQLTIILKNSVLEGLQIKISLDENGKYKAEFLAGSDQIKKQIEARKTELAQIFSERGLNFTGLDVKQDSDFSGQKHFESDSEENSGAKIETYRLEPESEVSEIENGEETFYRI